MRSTPCVMTRTLFITSRHRGGGGGRTRTRRRGKRRRRRRGLRRHNSCGSSRIQSVGRPRRIEVSQTRTACGEWRRSCTRGNRYGCLGHGVREEDSPSSRRRRRRTGEEEEKGRRRRRRRRSSRCWLTTFYSYYDKLGVSLSLFLIGI